MKQHHENPNFIDLEFSVGGKPCLLESVNVNSLLKVAVQQALRDSGNSGRDINDWTVEFNDTPLDLDSKIRDLNLPSGACIELILAHGAGG